MPRFMRRPKGWQWVLVALVSCLVLLVAFMTINPFGRVEISVLNDTGRGVRISGCVDDAADIDAGDTFSVSGVPDGDRLMCWEYHSEIGRCIAIPHAHEIQGTFALSRALHRPKSECESGWRI
jgi:hypothetical protein